MLTSSVNHKGLVINDIVLGDPDITPRSIPAIWGGTPVTGPITYLWDHPGLPNGIITADGVLMESEIQ